jgi:NAD-dependent dihydropyrimidine dehydrogenase PreA subunit
MVKRAIVQIDEEKCNGCGECIPRCKEGALKIVDGKARLVSDVYCDGLGACLGTCPRDAIRVIERDAPAFDEEVTKEYQKAQRRPSRLHNWPVQLNLVNPKAPFFEGADLLIMADCVPVASPDWQGTLLKGEVVLVGCPKFDDVPAYLEKLTEIFRHNTIKRITIVHMEVPCCSGLTGLVARAVKNAGKSIPVVRLVLSVEGEPLPV